MHTSTFCFFFGGSKVTSTVGGLCLLPFPMMYPGARSRTFYQPLPLSLSLSLSIQPHFRFPFIYSSLGYPCLSPARDSEICVCRQDSVVGHRPSNSDQLALAGVAVCLNVSGMFGPQASRAPGIEFLPSAAPRLATDHAIDTYIHTYSWFLRCPGLIAFV